MKITKKDMQLQRAYMVAVIAALLLVMLVFGKPILVPLFWSGLFAILLLPPAIWLEERIRHRPSAVLITLLLGSGIFCGILFLMFSQAYELIADIPQLSGKLSDLIDQARRFASESVGLSYENQASEIKSNLSELSGNLLGQTTSTLVTIGLIPFFTFFFMYYRDHFADFIQKFSKRKGSEEITDTASESLEIVQKYLFGMLIDTLAVAVLTGIALFALGIDYALFFALFMAIMNLIPFLGAFVATFITVLYVLITKDAWIYPALTLGILWAIQVFENNLLKPYIVGNKIKINPFAVVVIAFIGGLIWGASGMILFIPLAGIAKIIFDKIDLLSPFGFLIGSEAEENLKENAEGG